jgi:uncharacterized membrane protein YphA (DoxX/SURF4 family)
MNRTAVADLVLRLGVAFAFLYPPLDALADPYSWIGYFPPFLHGLLPDLVLLHGFGLVEVVIALWILSGRAIFWPCAAAVLMLLAIVFFNAAEFPVLFRDLVIAAAASALAVSHAPRMARRSAPAR